jgi:ubiquitin carboxyl-terminal hydrolase 22/27/51
MQVRKDAEGCPHILTALADDTTKSTIVSKYKTVVSWHVYRLQEVRNPAKRRKVSLNLLNGTMTGVRHH